MPRMVRKQIYIETEQDKALKKASRIHGVSQAELIRKGIGEGLLKVQEGPHGDDRAWKKAMKVMKELARKPSTPGARRTWKREDLYDR